ncbi:hypothetical protein [Rhizobium sp. MHM7A]|uniref:hypothetical protein n=1 Tax=Rhizobium sp. MHM7A TaxID=2583233 RepID=UPI001105AC9F|nr:hypothetical protein [Rhizobium sp. MHM7A]TLX16324.1 hypothetical protein FFR93_03060 [Rhizobium sp. MHM7A]
MSDYPEVVVQIPLISQAEAKYGRERAFRTVYYGEWVPFSLKQLGSDDAPVFARWDYMGGWSDAREVKGREIVRVFEDQFYRPYRGDRNRLASPHYDTSCLEQWGDTGERTTPLFAIAALGGDDRKKALSEFVNGELSALSPQDAKEIREHTLDAEATRLKTLGSSLIIVDGKVWERCNEPLLALDYHMAMGNSSVDVDVVFGGESTDRVELFRLNDREGLLDFLRLIRKLDNPHRQAPIVDNAANIEIELPQVISAEPERQSLLRVCKKIIAGAEDSILAHGKATTNAWFDLKAVVEAAEKDRDVELDEVLDVFRHFAAAHAKTEPLGNNYYEDRVELYANRIENRPLKSAHRRTR